jgi:sugar phosphate isomerase/epimerase
MKFALCNEAFENRSWADTVRVIAEAGYDGVEIAPFVLANSVTDISAAERAMLRKQAEDVGLEVVGLHWLFVSPKGLHTTTDDEPTRRQTTAYLQELIRFCGDLGGKVMVVGSPDQRDVQKGVPYQVAWQRFVDMILACLELAAERDVTLCMEPLPISMTNFVLSLDEAVQMVEEIAARQPDLSPWFQTMFDVHNACFETEPLPDLVRRHMSHIKHIHVNEMDGSHPGRGDFDFSAILRALQEANYQGYVSTEAFDFSPGPEVIAVESIRTLKAALA